MEIIVLERNQLHSIKNLWEELNTLHGQLSSNFKAHFESFTFEERIKKLSKKKNLSIFVASENCSNVGYCIATADNSIGEIDSIYIQPKYRGQGIGDLLMNKSLEWLDNQKCDELNIYVAEGNESVFRFYWKHGFKKRFTVLQKRIKNQS